MTATLRALFANRTRTILAVAIVLLSALLVGLVLVFARLLTPADLSFEAPKQTEMEWVRSMYGFGPSADEQLLSPSSVAIGPDGNVYATDPTRARVMVFSPDGTFIRIVHTGMGGTEEGQFLRPESIDVSEDNELYIADSWAKKIIVFDSGGRFVREWPVLMQARGISVSGDRVYVLDVGKVLVFDTQGTMLTSFSERGAGPGQIDAYQGVTARDGRVFVADTFNKRLQSFSESGSVEWVVPVGDVGRTGPKRITDGSGDGSGEGEMAEHRWDLPQDVVFDGAGRLIVVDAFNFELAVVDPETGKVSASYGEFGRYDGQFFYPTSIAYDPQRDWFAVADTQNNRVQIVRIPDSGASATAAAWRAVSSPYRYLAVPAALILAAIVAGLLARRRLLRRSDEGSDEVVLMDAQ